MKKIFVFPALLAALAACKGDEKAKDVETISQTVETSSVDGFIEKSFAILDKKFQNTAVTKWIFEGETQKSGDNSSAQFELPKRELKIGDLNQEDYVVTVNFPQNTVKASALKDDKALFTSQIDFSQYSLTDIKRKQDDIDLEISASFAGISDIKEIYDLTSQRLLSSEAVTKDLAFSYTYMLDIDGDKQSVEATYTTPEAKDTYVMTPGETTSDFIYTNTAPNTKMEQKQMMMLEADTPLHLTASYDLPSNETNINWKALGNAWFDTDHLITCFNSLVSFDNEDEMLKGGNCFWSVLKDTTLGEMKLTSLMPGAKLNYKVDLASLKDADDFKEIIAALNTDNVNFTLNTDIDIKADITEKDGLIQLSFFEGINNIDFSHDINKEALKTAAGEDAAMVDLLFNMASEFALKDIEIEMGGKIKRSSLQAVDDISDEKAWMNFDLGQSGFNYRLYFMTAKGFIDAEVIWDSPKDTLKAQDITEADFTLGKVILKIQNFDNFASSFAQVAPEAQFISAMIKGFGKADAKDASVLIFELSMSENGQPLINGTALPFM